jgi:hypothetical protein
LLRPPLFVRFANDSATRDETFSIGLIPAHRNAADTVPVGSKWIWRLRDVPLSD